MIGKGFNMKQMLFFLFLLISVSVYPDQINIPLPIIVSNHDAGQNSLQKSVYDLLNKADSSILLMSFTFSDPEVIKIINSKASAGVDVQLIVDRDHLSGLASYMHPSVKIGTRTIGEGHMHHKILVVDRSLIHLGSANFTHNSIAGSKNLAIIFESQDLAAALHLESEHIASHTARDPTQPLLCFFDNQLLELYILPHNQPQSSRRSETALNEAAKQKLLGLINSATQHIQISVETWTFKDASRALIMAQQRGVQVQVVTANLQEEAVKLLIQSGIAVKQGRNLHQKFMLIDNKTLLNGSPNWTMNAFSRSDESFIVLYDLSEDQTDVMKGVLESAGLEMRPMLELPESQEDVEASLAKLELVQRTITALDNEILNKICTTQEEERLVTIAKKLRLKLIEYIPLLKKFSVPGCCHYFGNDYLKNIVAIAEKQERIEDAIKHIKLAPNSNTKVSEYFINTLKKLQAGNNVPLPDFYHATRSGLENIIQTKTILQSITGRAGPGTYVSCNNEGEFGYGTHAFGIDEASLADTQGNFFTGRLPGSNVFYSMWAAVLSDITVGNDTIAFIDTSLDDIPYVHELLAAKNLSIQVIDRATSDAILHVFDASTRRRELPSFYWAGHEFLPSNLFRRSLLGNFRRFTPEE